jgi:hypothetical protein
MREASLGPDVTATRTLVVLLQRTLKQCVRCRSSDQGYPIKSRLHFATTSPFAASA